MNQKVLIIGAGASGYAAGCRLLQNGIKNITILEAQNRIGGRIHSINFGEGKVDMGAQWCHGEKDNVVYEMVKNLNLLQSSFFDYLKHAFVNADGKFVDDEVAAKLSTIAYNVAENEEGIKNYEGSFGDYFIERYNEEVNKEGIDTKVAQKVLNWFNQYFNSLNGSTSWFEVSAKGLSHYKMCEGNQTLNWKKQGYGTIFSVLKKKIPDPKEELPIDEKIIFNKEVTKITWNVNENDKVTVLCKDGTQYDADIIILTVSLGVLKENYKTMFVPDLPVDKKIAIENLGIGAVNKIFLKFKTRWWPEDSIGFCLLWGENDLDGDNLHEYGDLTTKDGKSWMESVFGFYPIDNNPNVLEGWVTGPLGPEIEKLSDEIVLKGCIFMLQKFVGKHYKISEVDGMLRTKWGTNKYFRGSYSHRTVDTEKYNTSAKMLSIPLKSAGRERVLFAGEATHSHFFSTVHGAIETGFREADRICKYQNCKL